jgi:Protein of unknown function (DUF1348)
MPGTPATRNRWPVRTPRTRYGATAASSSPAGPRSSSSCAGNGPASSTTLRKELWSFHGDRIAVRFQYESHDAGGQWYRSYGNELWEFDGDGLMRRREASINDVPISEADRRISGPRPEAERGRSIPLG